jgi:RecA/RadA recombinase
MTDEKKMYVPDFNNLLDEVEKSFKLSAQQLDPAIRLSSSLSTGNLVIDLIMGNGGVLFGSWYTFFGGEQSAKSTTIMNIVGNAFFHDIPIIEYWDFEQSTDPNYIDSMFNKKIDVNSLFGVRNDITGKWEHYPKIRYYNEVSGDKFFNAVKKLLLSLPDIEKIKDTWYRVYPNTRESQKLAGEFECNKKLLSKTGKYYFPMDASKILQGIILIDSYPSMLPTSTLEKEENDNSIATSARMFSDGIPKIRGLLKQKGISIIGVNQTRQAPMAFGNPEYEVGGQALKYYSDCRIKLTSRAVPHGKGQFEIEKSVNGGEDKYRYIHIYGHKNKTAPAYQEGWSRVWVSDDNNSGRGICPVYDTFQYLKMTGQVTGTMKKMSISLNNGTEFSCSWGDFKKLILRDDEKNKRLLEKYGLDFNLREYCFTQLKSGDGYNLFYSKVKSDV